MFEEQPLTFTTKSSNMLSATSGLWAWQSPGFSRRFWRYLRTSPPGVGPGEHLPGLPSSPGLRQNAPFFVFDSARCGFVVISQLVIFYPTNRVEQNTQTRVCDPTSRQIRLLAELVISLSY